MIRRSTLVIITLFVIMLAVAIYLTRSGKLNQAQVQPTVDKKNFLSIPVDLIHQIKIEDATGKYVTVERGSDGKWILVDPQLSPSDSTRIEQAINQFITMSVITTLEAGLAPEAVGMNPASSTITIYKTDGGLIKVQVGNVTAIGNGYYARLDQQAMQVVGKYALDQMLNLLSTPPVIVTPTLTFTPTPVITGTLQTSTPLVTFTPTILPTATATSTPVPAVTATSPESTVELTVTETP